ncbi:Proteinase inhibitor I13, potato inhibitor I [Corchorus capsularis]|uniref:Proteinase inhibitor I13, potato inhibitor I n=1 Tax=Corchorus capsularis TaxID=210143 RepID=A0A1R3H7Q7_COCAP|nr:Proteinase inhibitor I13, potato inhibitor I [Corchorus capsularis]
MAENQQSEASEKQSGESTDQNSIPVLPRTYGSLLGSNSTAPKMEWPELVGLTPEEAEKKIKEEMPRVRIQVVRANSFVTMDFNQARVRLFLDPSGKVQRPPRIG